MSLYMAWTDYNNVLLPGTGGPRLVNPFTKAVIPASGLTSVLSAGLGADQTLNIGSQSTGAGAGKATFDDLVITKAIDQNTATHFVRLCSGTPWQYVDVLLVEDAAEGTPALVLEAYRFGLVAGHNIARVLDGSPKPSETLNYEYGGVLYGCYAYSAGGTRERFVSDGWNRVRNVRWDGSPIT